MTIQNETPERPLRADAERNRAKIMTAAAQVFATRGLDATLDEVASAAGVGVGTVYRRFPDKEALIGALFEHAVDEIAQLAHAAATRDDSWDALVWFLSEALGRQCANRGLRDIMVSSNYALERKQELKSRLSPAITRLVDAAQRDGYLRADVVGTDFPIMEMMISFLGNQTAHLAPDLWRRYFTIFLDGLVVARDAPTPLPALPSDDVISQALHPAPRHGRSG